MTRDQLIGAYIHMVEVYSKVTYDNAYAGQNVKPMFDEAYENCKRAGITDEELEAACDLAWNI